MAKPMVIRSPIGGERRSISSSKRTMPRSPAVAPDADRTDGLDVQGTKVESGQCRNVLPILGTIDTEGSLEEVRRQDGCYGVPVAGIPARFQCGGSGRHHGIQTRID